MRLPVVVPAPELVLELYEMKVIAWPLVSEKVYVAELLVSQLTGEP